MKARYIIILLTSLLLFSSCEEWLDVKSDLDIYETTLFEEAEGYYAALNGLYMKMGGQNLYGQQLTYGAVEAWSRMYELNEDTHKGWLEIANFEYNNTEAKNIANNIWLSAFNVIAEANNLIQNLSNDTETSFPDGEVSRNMILGEAYAIRAMMHFEVVRIFAQAPAVDNGASSYVPYVSTFPSKVNTPLPTSEVLEKIIADLELAKDLIAPMDTLEGNMGYVSFQYNNVSYRLDLNDGYVTSVDDDFFKYRAHRLNYWAVTQVLARACLYAGNLDKAYQYANEIVEMVESNQHYSFTYPSAIACPVFTYSAEPRLHKEMLLGLYHEDFGDLSNYYWEIGSYSYLNIADVNDIFAANMADVRFTGGFYAGYLMKYYWNVTEETGGNVTRMNAVKNFIPVLRFPECYYIAAESIFDKDPSRAIEIFNLMVDARSNTALELSPGISKEAFMDAIVSEYRREFIGEGYLVYVYKRLNIPIRENGTEIDHHQQLVMPIPDNEAAISM